ncbi:MAG: NAD(P)/FAD-dependent oxidoreductase [Sandaracinaceae bacterium]
MTYDIVILGGGLAGNLLARQIRRTLPSLSVGLVEPTERASRKVGESTVEIASDYLVRRHDLSAYLYDRQLPKNGLRFFFDDPERNTSLLDMSELGSDHIPLFPTFQVDRARLEDDLRQMNVELGVDMRIGERVRDVHLERGTKNHRVDVRGPGGEATLEARWVIDCTGRHRELSRKMELATPVDHGLNAVWARYEGVQDLDTISDASWRGRVRYTSRVLSTNHFCYPGYWIWLIPLGNGVTSVGLVGEKDKFRRGIRTAEGFKAFLDEHRAVRELMADATLMDIGGYQQLAYGSRKFFGKDRWAVIGDAAAFVDPFYSPGSDFIAVENDLVTDLIRRDIEGDEKEPFDSVVETYDAFMKMRFDATLLLYQQQYKTLGSYEILHQKWNYDLCTYYNLWLDDYMRDRHLEPRHVRTHLRRRGYIMQALRNFRDLFATMADELMTQGHYHRSNLGRYNPGTDLQGFWRDVGSDRRRREINAVTADIFNHVRRESLELLGQREGGEVPLHEFMEERPLA